MNGTDVRSLGVQPSAIAVSDRHIQARARAPRLARVLPLADAPPAARFTRHDPRPGAPQRPVAASAFFAQLHREMRRAERTQGALSLVLYGWPENDTNPARQADDLLRLLCGHKRESDTVAQLDADTIAVLCPDTDAAGLDGFMRKIEALAEPAPRAGSVATYPDALFDTLLRGAPPPADLGPFLVADGTLPPASTYRLKRGVDVLVAGILLVLAAPLMAVVAGLIAATSKGPVIFRQTRLGRGGAPFTFYKFRSMAVDADDAVHRAFVARLIGGEAPADGADVAPAARFKLAADPRVTRIGRIIRKTSIDELPQLVNVLRGEMSLVGPRPPIPYEASHYEAWHLRRILSMTPGITGLWQVEGRSRVTFDEMVRMDLRYQRECSLRLDLRILLRTVRVVLRCDGAV